MLSDRENYIRNATMTGPEWMPCGVYISDATRDQLRGEIEEVMAKHPILFPDFEKGMRNYDTYEFGPAYQAGKPFTDSWGCVWVSGVNGLEGQVIEHPLADWGKLESYTAPDPMITADRGPVDWQRNREQVEKDRKAGRLTSGWIAHGFLFMRLEYLRGFENLMFDIASGEPNLEKLIHFINKHNKRIVEEWISMKVDRVVFGEDLGTQRASVISPSDFRKYIVPAYKQLMKPCRESNALVYLHSDGYIMEIMDDIINCGVDIINPQDLCNGIDALAKYVKGRVCISLDVDRQDIVPFGKPSDIHNLIEEEVRKLGSPKGGLEMIVGIYPPTPPENVEALCSAIEKYRTWWWDGRDPSS